MKLGLRKSIVLIAFVPLFLMLSALFAQFIFFSGRLSASEQGQDAIRIQVVQSQINYLKRELQTASDLVGLSRESTTAIEQKNLDHLFQWSRLFHSERLSGVIVTDTQGLVLVRSTAQFDFGDSLADLQSVRTALNQSVFWGVDIIDGKRTLVYSRPALLYEELPIGSVLSYAIIDRELSSFLSPSEDIHIVFPWEENEGEYRSSPSTSNEVRNRISFDPGFTYPSDQAKNLYVDFYTTPESDDLLRAFTLVIAINLGLLFTTVLFVSLMGGRYLRPYSSLIQVFTMFKSNEIDYGRLRNNLSSVVDGRNKEASAIASALYDFSYIIENDISQLKAEAHIDALTNLHNRRYAEKMLKWECNRHRNQGARLGLLICDIDNFKAINDTLGHHYGDLVLQKIGLLFQRIGRNADISARWGGEEFIVICPYTDQETMITLAEKLRRHGADHIQPMVKKKLMSEGIKLPPSKLPCGTFSIGCASIESPQSSDSFYNLIDKALYMAKDQGRNRVEAVGVIQN